MNVRGTRTLLGKELRRLRQKVGQTLLQPVMSTLLYFVVFTLSPGSEGRQVEGLRYDLFIAPGLVFLALASSSFQNSATSFFLTRVQGTLIDLIVAPLGPWEIFLGFVGGAIARGLLVGLAVWTITIGFSGIHLTAFWTVLCLAILTVFAFGALGLVAGLCCERLEQLTFFQIFFLPTTFLGGVFFPVRALSGSLRTAALLNPMAHMIDAMRGGFVGDTSRLALGFLCLVVLGSSCTALCWRLLHRAYKLQT
jgi:ABC-2 type transport system permease protein